MTGSSSYTSVRRASSPAEVVTARRLLAVQGGADPQPDALHVLAVEGDRAVGAIALITAEPGEQLPVDHAFGLQRDRTLRAVELSAPALRADRGDDPTLLMALLREAFDLAVDSDVDEVYLAADQPLLMVLRGHGFRFRAVSGPMWASTKWSIAAVLHMSELLPGLRLHQAVHGCRIADYFTRALSAPASAQQICARQVAG